VHEGSSLIGRVDVCARWGATRLFRELVSSTTADVNRLYDGRSMLHVACSCGSLDLVKVLVAELKADPNATSGARIDQDPSSRVSASILNYHTNLSFAVQSGSEETVRWLLEHGARAELDACLGCIIVASTEGHASLVKLFLEKLAPSMPGEGWVAGLFGQAAGHATIEDALLVAVEKASQQPSSIAALQQLLADMPARLKKKATAALISAIKAGNASAVAALLQHGVPATKGAGEWAPIHEAAIRGDLDVVQLLIQHGADAGKTSPIRPYLGVLLMVGRGRYAGVQVSYGGDQQQNAHMLALRSHGKPDVVEFLRTASSPAQKEAQLVFSIAVAVLALALVLVWFAR
jgi:ankyrin repeat protein